MAQYQLRQHVTRKHEGFQQSHQSRFDCHFCGQLFESNDKMIKHKMSCDVAFTEVRGNSRFRHQKAKDTDRTPHCRNGTHCRYLASGVCAFFHNGIGVQKLRSNEHFQEPPHMNDSQWCRYPEDCNRFPNCPYIHSNVDFPKLPNQNGPPVWERMGANVWKDY